MRLSFNVHIALENTRSRSAIFPSSSLEKMLPYRFSRGGLGSFNAIAFADPVEQPPLAPGSADAQK
jgi:hypothetical protein